MDLPIYCVIDTRPVKVVPTGDGGLDVLVYDAATCDFVRRMDLLDRVIMQDERVLELTEGEFEVHVAKLRGRFFDERRAG